MSAFVNISISELNVKIAFDGGEINLLFKYILPFIILMESPGKPMQRFMRFSLFRLKITMSFCFKVYNFLRSGLYLRFYMYFSLSSD